MSVFNIINNCFKYFISTCLWSIKVHWYDGNITCLQIATYHGDSKNLFLTKNVSVRDLFLNLFHVCGWSYVRVVIDLAQMLAHANFMVQWLVVFSHITSWMPPSISSQHYLTMHYSSFTFWTFVSFIDSSVHLSTHLVH